MRLDFNTVNFDDGEVVVVDRHGEFATDGLGDDTETVTLAGGDFLNGEGDLGSAVEAASTVHETGVSDRDETSSNVGVDQAERSVVPPISELDDGGLIVDVVQTGMRILMIVDNEWPTKTIKVLDTELRVIPERAGLVSDERNLVGEASVRCDRASGHEGGALIEGIRGIEEDTIEVHGSATTHGRIGELVVDGDSESISLESLDQGARIRSICYDGGPCETVRRSLSILNIECHVDNLGYRQSNQCGEDGCLE